MGNKYTTTVTGSTVGAIVVGEGAVGTGTVNTAAQPPTQEEHRNAIVETRQALVKDEDALVALDGRLYEALNQFLRLARDIQVEQKSMGELQAKMKETLDGVWAQEQAKGMKSQLLPRTLEVAKSLAANPLMVEAAKKLFGL